MTGAEHLYLIALGSNRRHPRIGAPPAVLAAALAELQRRGWAVEAVAPLIASRPLGPSARLYANGAALLRTADAPAAALALLKAVEQLFGRRGGGGRWRARVLDLDIILWNGGAFFDGGRGALQRAGQGAGAVAMNAASNRPSTLTIPHPLFRERPFVLTPAASIAPDWRDPITGFTLKQLQARLTRRNSLPKRCPGERALSSVGRATDF